MKDKEMKEVKENARDIARNRLPDDLKPVFDDLVVDYKAYSLEHHGRAFVSYSILADLVLAGWRLSAKPISTEKDMDI